MDELRAPIVTLAAAGSPRRETLAGRPCLVVPVTMLMEGVIHAVNAKDAELVPLSTLQAAAHSWNNKPVTLGHPVKDGRQCSANEPGVPNERWVGQMLNVRMDGKKMLGDAWLWEDAADRLAPGLLRKLEAGGTIEVSVGAMVHAEPGEGQWNGKAYRAAWRRAQGDHLALLPGGRGACSVEMGCGTCRAAAAHDLSGDEPRALWADAGGADDHGRDGGGEGHAAAADAHDKAAAMHEEAAKGAASVDASRAASQASARAVGKSEGARSGFFKSQDKTAVAAAGRAAEHGRDAYSHASNEKFGTTVKAGGTDRASSHLAAAQAHREAAAAHRRAGGIRAAEEAAEIIRGLGEGMDEKAIVRYLGLDKAGRDAIPEDDFAGPHRTYYVRDQSDLDSAVDLLGKADDPQAVRGRLVEIAKRKNLVLPKEWQAEEARAAAAAGLDAIGAVAPEELRALIGKRNNATDMKTIQAIHDHAQGLGAACDPANATYRGAGAAPHAGDPDGERRAACGCKEGEGTMMDKEKRATAIAALTTNPHSGFGDGDVALLEHASEAQLEAFRSAAEKRRSDADARTRAEGDLLNASAKVTVLEGKVRALEAAPTADEWLAKAPPEVRALIDGQKRAEEEKRADLVGKLKTLELNTEEELKAMSTAELERLAKFAKLDQPARDYSGRGLPADRRAAAAGAKDPAKEFAPPNPYEADLKRRAAAEGRA